ncbi:MAG: redox-regulated ATPase YchF [Candidatus Pacearchaeota archaeon]
MLIGLVGKPSSGKSTFFKAATLVDVNIASYPFTTINPNRGIGYVKIDCVDKEFSIKCQPKHGFCIKGNRFVPIEIIDVAGLVRGASEGRGLGNKFLDDLRQADAFIQIVDVSGTTDSEGRLLIEPTHDPREDILFLEEELDKWFFSILMKAWKNFIKKFETNYEKNFPKEVAKQFSGLKINEEHIENILKKNYFPERISSWNEENLKKFSSYLRRESKPMIIAANKIDLEKGEENYIKLKSSFPKEQIIPCSADYELALKEASKSSLIEYTPGDKKFEIKGTLNNKQKDALERIKIIIDKFGGTGVQTILNSVVFDILKHIAVFPVSDPNKLSDTKGNILPDCLLLPNNSTALDLAYSLHTEFGKNFIRGVDVRTKKTIGKEYKLKNRDIIEIITNTK